MTQSDEEPRSGEDPNEPPSIPRQIDVSLTSAWARLSEALPVHPATLVLAAVLALELVLSVLNARQKPFWYDELCTLYFASLHPYSALVEALRSGADTMTVPFMSIMNAALSLPGDAHVTLRLPAIVGYLLALAGSFFFVRKRLGGAAACVSLLIIALSPLRPYAVEARPYALLAGFLAVSAACWQRIGENRAAMPLLWLFFPLAVTVHYYAALAVAGVACAEFVHWLDKRQVRRPVWALLMFCAVLILTMLPFARAAKSVYGPAFWFKPGFATIVYTYTTYLRLDINLAVVLLAVALLVFPVAIVVRLRQKSRLPGFTPAELALALFFVLYPAIVVGAALAARGAYIDRYGWPGIIGLSFLFAVLFNSVRSAHLSAALLAAMALSFSFQAVRDIGNVWGGAHARVFAQRSLTDGLAGVAAKFPHHNLVVGDGVRYVEIFHYAGQDLRKRMVQLVDPLTASRISGGAIADVGNRQLARAVPLRLASLEKFLAGHDAFILYSSKRKSEWVPRFLLRSGYRMQLLREDASGTIYLAQAP